MPDDSLRAAISELAQRVGLRTSGIYTMDGSKRSGHSNAYFTGMGKAKRIVLFDTLFAATGPQATPVGAGPTSWGTTRCGTCSRTSR